MESVLPSAQALSTLSIHRDNTLAEDLREAE